MKSKNPFIIMAILALWTAFCSMPAHAGLDAMQIAIQKGDKDTVLQLLDAGYNMELADAIGNTPLLQACFEGQEGLVHFFIERGAKVNIQPPHHGLSPLMVVSARGLEGVVKALIHAGSYVNAKGKRGQTALYLSVFSKNAQVVQVLLQAGADPNLTDDFNQAPLFLAANLGQIEMAKMLLEHGADVHNRGGEMEQDALIAASTQGDFEMAKLLMEKGATFHIPDKQGMTALMFASQLGHTDIVNLMLARYAHPLLPPFVESMQEKKSALNEKENKK